MKVARPKGYTVSIHATKVVTRRVPFIPTAAPGIVITPAGGITGRYAFSFGCVLTHTPTGHQLAGRFHDVGVAMTVARVLGELMDWNQRDLAEPEAVAIAARNALKHWPEVYAWLGKLNQWEAM